MTRTVFARYTGFSYDPNSRQDVLDFWQEVGGPVATQQPGFLGAVVLDSYETDGVIRALTFWQGPDDFEQFATTPGHDMIGAGIKATTMSTIERDGLESIGQFVPASGLVRHIRCRLDGSIEELREFWHTTGKPLTESAPGCISANAFIDDDADELLLVFHWRSQEHADAFVQTELHEQVLVQNLEKYVTRLERRHMKQL